MTHTTVARQLDPAPTFGHLPYIVAEAARQHPAPMYDGAQLAGEECAVCEGDFAYVDTKRTHAVVDGHQLYACAPHCRPAEERPSPKYATFTEVPLPTGAKLLYRETGNTVCVYYDPAQITPLAARELVRIYFAYVETTPTPAGAELAVRQAITEANDGLTTHPRTVADQLHRAIDDQSAKHAEQFGHTARAARASEAFATANQSMGDALRFSENRERTITALRTALKMAIDETAGV